MVRHAVVVAGGMAAAASAAGKTGLVAFMVVGVGALLFARWLLSGDPQTDRLVRLVEAAHADRGRGSDESEPAGGPVEEIR